MNFICFIAPGTAHNPYPGVRITANSQTEAAALAVAQLNPVSAKFFVIPEEAFTANCFQVQGAAPVAAPPYV